MNSNKIFKNIFSLALAVLTVLSLSGCGDAGETQKTTEEISDTVTSPELQSGSTQDTSAVPTTQTLPTSEPTLTYNTGRQSNTISPSEEMFAQALPKTPSSAGSTSGSSKEIDAAAASYANSTVGEIWGNKKCATYVSNFLEKIGYSSGIEPSVSNLRTKLEAEGWTPTYGEPKTGDVLITKGGGVSHAAVVYNDPQTGQAMVAHHSGQKSGVKIVPYSQYIGYFGGHTTRLRK